LIKVLPIKVLPRRGLSNLFPHECWLSCGVIQIAVAGGWKDAPGWGVPGLWGAAGFDSSGLGLEAHPSPPSKTPRSLKCCASFSAEP